RQQGGVCSDDHDDRADIGAMSIERDLIAHGHSGDTKQVAHAKVALNQHANGVAAKIFRDLAGRCACTTLEFETNHSGATAHVALSNWSRMRVLHRGDRVLGLYVKAIDVVQFAIP